VANYEARLKHRRLGAHTVQVKVRYGDFTTLTRQFTVEEPLTEAGDIYRLAFRPHRPHGPQNHSLIGWA